MTDADLVQFSDLLHKVRYKGLQHSEAGKDKTREGSTNRFNKEQVTM